MQWTPETIKKARDLFREVDAAYGRIETEKALIKDAIEAASDELQIDKSILKKAADMYTRQNLAQKTAEFEEVSTLVQSAIS